MEALHPKREPPQHEQKSPALADEQQQATPTCEGQKSSSCTDETSDSYKKVKLIDVNSSLTCELCKGYLIDATTISECLHSFCRSCIIKFLQENSFCPVCEVIINKAKPNLKLDKTLQDIVYKLVPGLFLSEMMRRQHYYADKPLEVGRTSPEQRGEDTERTIFNPQERISLSLEYIGDDATTGLILKDLKKNQEASDHQVEALLKRYLECPAMCRIDVIKKFIRNKYNVDTDLFQIDILYKRVPLPLPGHYTLIDVAYIYTWKRNEPMRFYFRIVDKGNDEPPDLTKVFTPSDDAPFLPLPIALSVPNRSLKSTPVRDKSKRTSRKSSAKKLPVARQKSRKDNDKNICDKKLEDDKGSKRQLLKSESAPDENVAGNKVLKTEDSTDVASERTSFDKHAKTASEHCDNKVYTNITLNRSNNLEIVTKVQKDTQQIEVNIIDQSTRKKDQSQEVDTTQITPKDSDVKTETTAEPISKAEEPSSSSKSVKVKDEEPSSSKGNTSESTTTNTESTLSEVSSTTNDLTCDEEMEKTKFEFLKSIELTSKKVVDNLARLVHQQRQNNKTTIQVQKNQQESITSDVKAKKATKPEGNGLKRKNSSPIRIEPKRTKTEPKRTTKIILQQKPGYPPLNLTKPNKEKSPAPEAAIKNNRNELRSLFQNCKLNIPSSLSITLKENGETSRQPVQMPPVQNFIEILKIDEKAGTQTVNLKREDVEVSGVEKNNPTGMDIQGKLPKNATSSFGNSIRQADQEKKKRKETLDSLTKEQQSFQKIFEESIKKSPGETDKVMDIDAPKVPINVPASPLNGLSNLPLAMTQKLQKVAIPKLNSQKMMRGPKKYEAHKKAPKYETQMNQTLANLHSSSLGLNYTVSVGKQQRELMKPSCSNGFMMQPRNNDSLYKKPTDLSLRPIDVKTERESPRKSQNLHSPRPGIGSPAPKKEPASLPIPLSSPRIFTPHVSPKSTCKTSSPRPKSRNQSPKPSPSASSSASSSSSLVPALTANELLEKYNIQNLAQLSASMNYNAQAYLSSMSNKQMSALHQSMLMKQMEAQNRQNWFAINPLPLLQYEKYLQTLNASKNQIMGNLKDN